MKSLAQCARTALIAAAATMAVAATPASAATKMQMVVFGPPSLGAFLPPIIQKNEFDEKNGLELEFVERPPGAYNTQFNSGEFQLGGSAALLSVANAKLRGVDVVYLFNIFDYFGVVVTDDPDIKSLEDLKGKTVAAATATTNYAMFRWLLQKQGVDADDLEVVNTATPGLISYMLADRADAVQLWEPAYSVLKAQKPDIRALDLKVETTWKAFADSDRIPYLGVAAHADWAQEHAKDIPALIKTYQDAADWVLANPDEAADIIAGGIKGGDASVIADLIRDNGRLALQVVPAGDLTSEINAVFEAGVDLGYLGKIPDASVIFQSN